MIQLPRSIFKPIRGLLPRYGTAILLAGLATGVRFASDHMLPSGFPFLTFFPVVILSTFVAGRGPGILCALLGGLSAWYWFIPPLNSFYANGPVVTALAFYAFVVAVDIALIDGLLARQRQLVDNQRQLADMADHQTLLFKELQHRVANNLASISSMLRLQRRRIEREPTSALALVDSANSRIELMGRIHRQLYDPAARQSSLADQIGQVVRQAQDVAGATHVEVTVDAINARIAVDRMMTLMLLVTEVLTNSIKHAFAQGQPGKVHLRLERVDEGRLRMTIADDGCGIAEATGSPVKTNGLGTTIIRGFASQLNGTLQVDGSNGVTTTVEFPEDID